MRHLPHLHVKRCRVLLLFTVLLRVGHAKGADAASPPGKVVIRFSMVFNKPWFDAQSQANQHILLQAMQEAGRWQRQAMMNRDANATQRIKEAGVHELTTQAREQFRQPALKVHERFADRVDKDYLQRVYAAIMQASK